MNTPAEIIQNYVVIGVGKTKLSIPKMLIRAFLAGVFIAFAGVGATTAAVTVDNASIAKWISACIFPAGLAMVLIAGSELFTGNCLMIIPLLERKATLCGVLKNCLFVYLGNLLGGMTIAAAVVFGHTYDLFSNALAGSAIDTAAAKC